MDSDGSITFTINDTFTNSNTVNARGDISISSEEFVNGAAGGVPERGERENLHNDRNVNIRQQQNWDGSGNRERAYTDGDGRRVL